MSNTFKDAVRFTAASAGTGDFVVNTAVQGFRTPATASVPNASTSAYRAESSDLSEWEEGVWTYASGTTTCARTTVTANHLGTTAKVNFTAAPQVALVQSSADITDAGKFTTGTVPTARLPLGTGANQVPQLDSNGHLLNAIMGASSIAANGYYTLPGGLIIQWGYQSTLGANTTFPTTFPNNCFSVMATKQQNPVNGSQTQALEISIVSTSGFQVDTSPGNVNKTAYYWIAIGN